MFTFDEILVNALSVLVGLLSALVAHKLIRRRFRNDTFLNLYVVLGFLAMGVAFLTRFVFLLLMLFVVERPLPY